MRLLHSSFRVEPACPIRLVSALRFPERQSYLPNHRPDGGGRCPPLGGSSREPVAEGAVHVAQAEPLQRLRMRDAPALHEPDHLRAVPRSLVVEADHSAQQLAVLDRHVERRRQLAHRRRFGAGPSPEVGAPLRSSSTACRKLTPSARITQSITLPPAAHAPMQCHSFFAGEITRLGSRSSWNGQSPIMSLTGLACDDRSPWLTAQASGRPGSKPLGQRRHPGVSALG